MSEPFIGQVQLWGCNYAPTGWAFCDGSSIPIAQNPSLFSIISTFYGGDGRVNFNLPSLGSPSATSRGAISMGKSPGLSNYYIGQASGAEYVALSASQMPSHTHSIMGSSTAGTSADPTNNNLAAAVKIYSNTVSNEVHISPNALANEGKGTPHENRQPSLTLNFCIAMDGIYPTRS